MSGGVTAYARLCDVTSPHSRSATLRANSGGVTANHRGSPLFGCACDATPAVQQRVCVAVDPREGHNMETTRL